MAVKTIGTVPLSCCRAATATELNAKMASGFTASSSPAKCRFCSGSPAVQRSSICRLPPTLQPNSSSRLRNAATQPFVSASPATPISTPIRRTPSRCCARAESGHPATPQPRNAMNSGRLMGLPKAKDQRSKYSRSGPCIAAKAARRCPLWVVSSTNRRNTFESWQMRRYANGGACTDMVHAETEGRAVGARTGGIGQ